MSWSAQAGQHNKMKKKVNDSPLGPLGEDSDASEEEHNAWNSCLGFFTLKCSSSKIQQSLNWEEPYKVALTSHFALDTIYMSREW